jgi:glycosyltransferase involved in cell wall biosynthesis
VRFPLDPGRAVRTVGSDDPADLAAALAELLADTRERRDLSVAGERYADRFDPERVAGMVSDGMDRSAS